MTSENEAGNDSRVVDGADRADGRPGAAANPDQATGPAAEVRVPAAGAAPADRARSRRFDLDWENEPVHGIDPEDSRGGRADNLARLLDDIPPHHVDH